MGYGAAGSAAQTGGAALDLAQSTALAISIADKSSSANLARTASPRVQKSVEVVFLL
jgi:hypothetical protein